MRVRQFRYYCKKCSRTITVPGRVGVCPICGTKFDAEPKEIRTERDKEQLDWGR